ncbi:MAG: GAF domain-containing sensor histidine kinase [Candidatus Rokuibacteriota bacterium]
MTLLALPRWLGRAGRYRELEGLHEISRAFAAMTDIRETYGRLTRRIAELIGAEKCVISLYNPETREMVGQAPGYNVPDHLIARFRYPADLLRTAWNFRGGAVMVNKRPADFDARQQAILEPFGVYNLTEAPLMIEGRFIGKVSMGNKPGGFSTNDVRLLTVFAAQAAIAIQNARLYTRLSAGAAELEDKVRLRTAELERTYRDLAASHDRLRELDQLKSDFLGNVSHELRTPLAAIKGYVDNLLDGVVGPLPDRQHHYLVRVRDNAQRLHRMVSDLLDLARIEAGKVELAFETLGVAEAIAEAVESLRPAARARDVDLVVEVDGCSRLWGDPDKVHQVLTNLVSNAVKFSPHGRPVRISVTPAPARMVRIAVSDAGPGVPPGERERIFDKFYQVGRVDGERLPGTGLGLAIVRHLVELHGGRVWAEGGAGAGATFVALLPASASADR